MQMMKFAQSQTRREVTIAYGMTKRSPVSSPPTVEYKLTELGFNLGAAFCRIGYGRRKRAALTDRGIALQSKYRLTIECYISFITCA